MPGQMGKIQGLEQFLQFQKLFKGQMLFQRLFKARSNHVTIIFHNTAPPFRPPPHPLKKKQGIRYISKVFYRRKAEMRFTKYHQHT